jgi:hypothetical protein
LTLQDAAELTMRRTDNAQSERSPPYWTGLGLAAFLAAAFLAIPLVQTLTTFFIRLYEADVMLGAVGNVSLDSRVSLDVALFSLGILILHGLLALAVHVMALLTERAWPAARGSRHGLVVVWFALAVAAILLLNGDWFPRSHAGTHYSSFASQSLGPVSVAEAVALLAAGLAAVVSLVAFCRVLPRVGAACRGNSAFYLSAMSVVGIIFLAMSRGAAPAEAVPDKPNVVILGLDSLRLAELRRFGGRGWTPNLDAFLKDADLFPDTVTPLGRTFPSWVSILTGQAPRSTGAVFNLVRREDVSPSPTIADLLATQRYTTVFATDDVRFSNIDESYGFDRIITPPIGAADFLIAQVGDLPLSNVVASTPLGRVLLKYVHANRGVAFLYRPATFIGRIQNELPEAQPLLAVIHLTAAHWPYFHADTPLGLEKKVTDGSTPVYREALQTADRMFGEIVQVLQDKGILDNALVIVLSDHGEALGMPADSLLNGLDGRVAGLDVPVQVLNWGHGQSVLSPVQYQVLLGFRGFGSHATVGTQGRELMQPASLEDVVPTLMDLLHMKGPAVDGLSLAPSLRSGRSDGAWRARRIRFTETDIRVAPSDDGALEEEDAARQAAQLFEVDRASGWLHLRPGMIEPLVMMKERAALDETRLLAALPVAPDRHQYLLVDRQSGQGRVLASRPDSSDPDAQRLWDALHDNFPGELKPPVLVTPEAQQQFAHQWAAHPAWNQGSSR